MKAETNRRLVLEIASMSDPCLCDPMCICLTHGNRTGADTEYSKASKNFRPGRYILKCIAFRPGAVESLFLPNISLLFNHTPAPPHTPIFSSSAGEFSHSQQDQDLLLSFSSARLSSSSFQGNRFLFLQSSNTTAALSTFQRHTLLQQYVLSCLFNTRCVTSRPTTSAVAAASRL